MAENKDNLQQNGQRRRQRRGGGPSAILAPGEKPQDFRRAVKDTLSYMGGYKLAVVFVILISALATIFAVAVLITSRSIALMNGTTSICSELLFRIVPTMMAGFLPWAAVNSDAHGRVVISCISS